MVKRYRSDIEGLRAVAVLPVIFFHYGLGFPGGFVGVDVFFVISGYLITSLIVEDMRAGKFSLSAFWERRVRRIVPAMMAMILFSLIAAYLLFLPDDFRIFGKSLIAQILCVSNFFFWKNTGYFDGSAELVPLLHTWSLAVEEQFYIIFPIVLLLATRLKISKTRLILIALFFSLIISILGVRRFPSPTFYLLPTRAWELLIGAFLAINPRKGEIKQVVAELSAWAGGIILCLALFLFNSQTRFPGEAAVLPCLGAGLLIWANESTVTSLGRILSWRIVRLIGAISYSLYLWHWPILVFLRYWGPEHLTVSIKAVAIVSTFMFAWASWMFVETPFRVKRIFPHRQALFRATLYDTALFLTLGSSIFYFDGLPRRFSTEILQYEKTAQQVALSKSLEVSLNDARQGNFKRIGSELNTNEEFLLWGDSHAMAVFPALDELGRRYKVRGYAAMHSATAPVLDFYNRGLRGDSVPYNKAVVDFITERRINSVFIVANWIKYCDQNYSPTSKHPRTGSDAIEAFNADLQRTVASILAVGSKVYLMSEVPDHGFDPPKELSRIALFGGENDKLGSTVQSHLDRTSFSKKALSQAALKGAILLDPSTLLTNEHGVFPVVRQGKVLYRDTHHLSVEGALELIPLFETAFKSLDPSRAGTRQ